jgi:hypothetical protein
VIHVLHHARRSELHVAQQRRNRTDPNNTVTTYEYYSPDGSVSGCPKDATGFVRFVKSVTTTPPTTQYTDVSPQVVRVSIYRLLNRRPAT